MSTLPRRRRRIDHRLRTLVLAGGFATVAAQAAPISTFELSASLATVDAILAQDSRVSKPDDGARVATESADGRAQAVIDYGLREIGNYVASFDEKTRVTQVVRPVGGEGDDGDVNRTDCLVVIYTKEPTLLGKRFVLEDSPTRVGRGTDMRPGIWAD